MALTTLENSLGPYLAKLMKGSEFFFISLVRPTYDIEADEAGRLSMSALLVVGEDTSKATGLASPTHKMHVFQVTPKYILNSKMEMKLYDMAIAPTKKLHHHKSTKLVMSRILQMLEDDIPPALMSLGHEGNLIVYYSTID